MQLHPIDLGLVLLYLVGIAVVGVWVGRGIRTGKDLFLGGRSLPWWAVGASLVVSDIGAKDMVGLADDGYRFGLVMANFDLIGCIFPVLIAAFLFMPYLSLIQGALLALLLMGMLTRRATQWGGLAGLIVGVGAAGAMQQSGMHLLWVAWWSFVTSLFAIVAVSLFTHRYSDERLRGLV